MATRSLYPQELVEVQHIFGVGLDTARVIISEGNPLPNWVGRIGAFIKRCPAPVENAITVRDTSYFPRELTADVTDVAWLIHELTHQWQYQHDGIRYLFEALRARTYVYTAPGETPSAALKRLWRENKKFRDFNREQQGDIIRDCYLAMKQPLAPQDLAAWEPYLREIREPPS